MAAWNRFEFLTLTIHTQLLTLTPRPTLIPPPLSLIVIKNKVLQYIFKQQLQENEVLLLFLALIQRDYAKYCTTI